jgi:hypothetical protein
MVFWLSVILILAFTALALVWAVSTRRRRLEKKLKLEISNQGNTESRFQLQAEDLTGGLDFRFLQEGSRLPEVILGNQAPAPTAQPVERYQPQPQPESAAPGGAERAMGFTGAIASLLVSVGSILPGSVGSSIMRTGTQISRQQAQASRIQQVSSQAAAFGKTGGGTTAQSVPRQAPISTAVMNAWAETPVIQPGGTLMIDLVIHSHWVPADTSRPFLLKSRCTACEHAPLVAEDGAVQVKGGFWSHRVYPVLLILALGLGSLLAAFWLARY